MTCIAALLRCNGRYECPDASDELDCGGCSDSEFQCTGDGNCIPNSKLCNYQFDCEDGSDEVNCDDEQGVLTSNRFIKCLLIHIIN